MIIDFRKLASNIAQRYEIAADGYHYAQLGRFWRRQPITFITKDSTVYVAKFMPPSDGMRNRAVMYLGDEEQAIFGSVPSVVKSRYVMYVGDKKYDAYCYANGSPSYFSVYDGDTQIALLETPLETTGYLYTHTLYLLEDYAHLRDALIMFVLYYCNYAFTRRFHMRFGECSERRYISGGRSDPEWKKRHFP